MKKNSINKKILLSPTQLIGFLNCKFWVVHNYKGTKKKKISFSKEALFEKGREHEKNYLNKALKEKYKNVVEIKGGSE